MKIELSNNKDFLAGLLMIVIGGGAFWMALDFPMGSALRMGPGYFPRVLAGIMVAFGLYVLIRGLKFPERVKGKWGWWPLTFVVVAFWLFGFIMDRLGMIPALVVMFFVSAYGGAEFKFKEVAILTVVMSILAVAVFIYGLGLPYRLFWW